MTQNALSQWLPKFLRTASPRAARITPAARLSVEGLEARDVPALFTVNTLADTVSANGELSLREAISLNTGALTFNQLSAAEKAQVFGTVGSNDTVNFAVVGNIALAADLPALTKKLTISGPGAGQLVIDGGSQYRPLQIGANGDVTVTGLRITHAHNADSGGAALNNGKLTLSQVEFEANTSGKHGGAIENNGTLTVNECYFHNNTAAKVGGAIDNNATAVVTNSTLSNNTAGNTGGAVWSDAALTLTNSTLAGNRSVNAGGALRLTGGTVVITSCTITGNTADTDASNFESGGGISADGANVVLNNTVVAQNTTLNGATKDDIAGAVSGQFNFIGVSTGMSGITNGATGNRVGTNASPLDPLLQPLAFNGGFGPTRLPATGSPLIGTGAAIVVAGATDQRGTSRTAGATTVGAVEVSVPQSQQQGQPQPTQVFAVATGAGVPLRVRAYNADGTTRFDLNPFPGFAGGASVATADVTGDGIEDIIVGAGAGAPNGHVKVFDGATGAEIRSFFAFTGFAGAVSVAAGDIDGDGKADILVGSGAGAPNGHVKVFDGVTDAEVRSFFAYVGYAGGVTVASGDINGDGKADIVTGTAALNSHVKAFDGTTGAELRSFLAFPGFLAGVNVGAGDLDGDGKAEILVGAATTASHIKAFDGGTNAEVRSFFAFPGFPGGVDVAGHDRDGDGKAEIVVGAGANGNAHVKVFVGLSDAELASVLALDGIGAAPIFVG